MGATPATALGVIPDEPRLKRVNVGLAVADSSRRPSRVSIKQPQHHRLPARRHADASAAEPVAFGPELPSHCPRSSIEAEGRWTVASSGLPDVVQDCRDHQTNGAERCRSTGRGFWHHARNRPGRHAISKTFSSANPMTRTLLTQTGEAIAARSCQPFLSSQTNLLVRDAK